MLENPVIYIFAVSAIRLELRAVEAFRVDYGHTVERSSRSIALPSSPLPATRVIRFPFRECRVCQLASCPGRPVTVPAKLSREKGPPNERILSNMELFVEAAAAAAATQKRAFTFTVPRTVLCPGGTGLKVGESRGGGGEVFGRRRQPFLAGPQRGAVT